MKESTKQTIRQLIREEAKAIPLADKVAQALYDEDPKIQKRDIQKKMYEILQTKFGYDKNKARRIMTLDEDFIYDVMSFYEEMRRSY